ncbi:hypothetical protein NBRC116494_31420 [Aurantivibrio plasticivorans]
MARKTPLSLKAMVLVLSLSLCQWAFAQQPAGSTSQVREDPSMLAMSADLVVVRPVMFGVTVIGSAIWLVALPFTAASGSIKQSGSTLVVGPAKNTFVRCLGCTTAGYVNETE